MNQILIINQISNWNLKLLWKPKLIPSITTKSTIYSLNLTEPNIKTYSYIGGGGDGGDDGNELFVMKRCGGGGGGSSSDGDDDELLVTKISS